MPKYIEVEELESLVQKEIDECITGLSGVDDKLASRINHTVFGESRVLTIAKNMPSADVVEVKHGEWQTVNEDWNVYECSVCQHEFMLIAGKPRDNSYNFCPNCGADMDTRGDKDA